MRDEKRDPNMLYDDSDQQEFQESIALLAETVRWDLHRYNAVRLMLGLFEDEDQPLAKVTRITELMPAKRPDRGFTC